MIIIVSMITGQGRFFIGKIKKSRRPDLRTAVPKPNMAVLKSIGQFADEFLEFVPLRAGPV